MKSFKIEYELSKIANIRYIIAETKEEAMNIIKEFDKRKNIISCQEVSFEHTPLSELSAGDLLKLIKSQRKSKKELINKIQYKEGIALQVFTRYQCKICGKTHSWHNNLVPDFCESCASDIINKIIE